MSRENYSTTPVVRKGSIARKQTRLRRLMALRTGSRIAGIAGLILAFLATSEFLSTASICIGVALAIGLMLQWCIFAEKLEDQIFLAWVDLRLATGDTQIKPSRVRGKGNVHVVR